VTPEFWLGDALCLCDADNETVDRDETSRTPQLERLGAKRIALRLRRTMGIVSHHAVAT
jgi:hypothetical protein